MEPVRCPGALKLRLDWLDIDVPRAGGMSAELYVCPPCRIGLRSPWLVRLGYHECVVDAGCQESARITAYTWFRRRGNERPDRARWIWERLQEAQRDRITAHPATDADVARIARMIWEGDHRKALDTTA